MKRSVALTLILGSMIGFLVMRSSPVYANGNAFSWNKHGNPERDYPAFNPIPGQPPDATIQAQGKLVLSGEVNVKVRFRVWDVDPKTGGVIESSETTYKAAVLSRAFDQTTNTTTFQLQSQAEDEDSGEKEIFALGSQYLVAFVVTWTPPGAQQPTIQIFGTKIVTAAQ